MRLSDVSVSKKLLSYNEMKLNESALILSAFENRLRAGLV